MIFLYVEDREDDAYNAVYRKLLEYKPLVQKRELVVEVHVLTFGPQRICFEGTEVEVAGPDTILDRLNAYSPISDEELKLVKAVIQRVTSIKAPTKRTNVQRQDSRGATLQAIESKIANFDQWQKRAAIECPDGPQRVRGLAGSGKTIVLALKAAYLHAANPEWDIAVTFNTRALYQQFTDLIRRFCFEHKNDEPDWTKLRILHAWGSSRQSGVYSEITKANDLPTSDFSSAKAVYGADRAFGGICDELLTALKRKHLFAPLFDAVLIDEGQDLPQSFFELCYLSTRTPKRIVWAYDELQNLGSYSMVPPFELFGKNARGEPNVPNLDTPEGTARRDIVLPVCYRNTPWSLTVAHAIGFGIYRPAGLVQSFDNPGLWQEIGYHIVDGELTPGHNVVLERSETSYPRYFAELLNPEDCVSWHAFQSDNEQVAWVAEQIHTNLTVDELRHTDILVVIPNAITAKVVAGRLIEALDRYQVSAHLAGVTTSVDRLFQEGSIAIGSIFRAKGNEGSMVYVLDSDYAIQPFESVRGRNAIFTAITRSRAWVRICGSGPNMVSLIAELQAVRENAFRLRFSVPTAKQLDSMRRIHRDLTEADIAKHKTVLKGVEQFLALIESGELAPEAIPAEFRRRLAAVKAEDDAE